MLSHGILKRMNTNTELQSIDLNFLPFICKISIYFTLAIFALFMERALMCIYNVWYLKGKPVLGCKVYDSILKFGFSYGSKTMVFFENTQPTFGRLRS